MLDIKRIDNREQLEAAIEERQEAIDNYNSDIIEAIEERKNTIGSLYDELDDALANYYKGI